MEFKNLNLKLIDINNKLCDAWKMEFEKCDNVQIINGVFQDVADYDCIVSPANSYGKMDGGIDLIIRNYFGMELQNKVQKVIQESYYGEQPVGTSFLVETGNIKHPFLAHTPTMRVPMDISNTDNVYNAMYAMLRTIANYNKTNNMVIKSVLCPGLGTATGKVSPSEAARQMALAYRFFKQDTNELNWNELMIRNNKILKK